MPSRARRALCQNCRALRARRAARAGGGRRAHALASSKKGGSVSSRPAIRRRHAPTVVPIHPHHSAHPGLGRLAREVTCYQHRQSSRTDSSHKRSRRCGQRRGVERVNRVEEMDGGLALFACRWPMMVPACRAAPDSRIFASAPARGSRPVRRASIDRAPLAFRAVCVLMTAMSRTSAGSRPPCARARPSAGTSAKTLAQLVSTWRYGVGHSCSGDQKEKLTITITRRGRNRGPACSISNDTVSPLRSYV